MTKSQFCSKIKFNFIDMYLVSLINCITFYLFSSCWHYWLYQLHCFTRWDTQKWFLSAIHLPMVIHIGLDIDCPLFDRIWNFCGACQSLFWQCVPKWQVQLLFHVSWPISCNTGHFFGESFCSHHCTQATLTTITEIFSKFTQNSSLWHCTHFFFFSFGYFYLSFFVYY